MTLTLTPMGDGTPAGDLLNGLNAAQAEAVSTTEGPVLIIAGAGSGKTRVLTFRIAYLLRLGVNPSHVLALTFTNKAAQEMKERISHLVGGGIARSMMAGTFHSVFARILRQFADRIGYTSSFTIYDTDDQAAAIKAVMNQLGVSQQVVPVNGVRGRISSAKNSMISWQEYVRSADSVLEKQTGQIFEEYEKRLAQSNAMDFDDLLLNTIRLLEHHPDVLESLQDRFRYLLVDEYQDTNRAQYQVVTMLARKYRNLCVVGDDAQSIYRWRGADIRNILDFERDYPESKVVRLEQNYRSTKTILAAADSVIKRNTKQLKKSLFTDNIEGEKITVLACRDDREEADMIARTIRSRVEKYGYSYKDVAILYRTNAQSQALEDALRRGNTPYHIVSGVSFYKRKEVKDVLAYLRLLVNPNDTESILRVINEPARGIGATTLERVQEFAVRTNSPVFEVLSNIETVPMMQARTAKAVKDFVGIIARYQEMMPELAPASLAQAYIEATGLPQMYKLQQSEEALDRWNNIERLLDHIAEQQELDENMTLINYLEQIALLSDADDPKLGTERIAMMTMHAAKGLEFPLVVIAGLEQGLFPLAKAETDMMEQEEERRLLYVGITRAREQLVLSYAERRYRFGELVFSRPSMFLGEIDKDTLAPSARSMTGNNAREAAPRTAPSSPKQSSYSQVAQGESYSQLPMPKRYTSVSQPKARGVQGPAPEGPSSVKVGQRVKHPMFGAGTISSVSGTGQSEKATVLFDNGQRKQLMVAFARLEAL
ncbi:MAG: UvrD-helicase domain-containing protein [Ignavibacteria bacterium]|nr:UvrD-helicase domain-containing protein [Ignavibacteria bacterium]MBK6419194.1 UvrD-helicase domain-containing protein [Ignavibacteria bacterium]MBK7412097.1 UvrD-helicase domain-containing protein [Ignavibacteria bacterium]